MIDELCMSQCYLFSVGCMAYEEALLTFLAKYIISTCLLCMHSYNVIMVMGGASRVGWVTFFHTCALQGLLAI